MCIMMHFHTSYCVFLSLYLLYLMYHDHLVAAVYNIYNTIWENFPSRIMFANFSLLQTNRRFFMHGKKFVYDFLQVSVTDLIGTTNYNMTSTVWPSDFHTPLLAKELSLENFSLESFWTDLFVSHNMSRAFEEYLWRPTYSIFYLS